MIQYLGEIPPRPPKPIRHDWKSEPFGVKYKLYPIYKVKEWSILYFFKTTYKEVEGNPIACLKPKT